VRALLKPLSIAVQVAKVASSLALSFNVCTTASYPCMLHVQFI